MRSLKTQVTFSSPNFDFCACPSRNVLKRDPSGKKGMLSCCKCLLELIEASLAHIQHENHQRSPKCAKSTTLAKCSESQWVNNINMKNFKWRKCRKIFFEVIFSHSRKIYLKFQHIIFVIILRDITGLENFLLSFSQS